MINEYEVKMVKCRKSGNYFRIEQNMIEENLDNLRGKCFLGYGIEGYAVACVYGILLKIGVTFGREKEKTYGTQKNVDGITINPDNECVLFCERNKIESALERFDGYNIICKYVFDIDISSISKIKYWEGLKENASEKQNQKLKLEKYIQCLQEKEYILSSGQLSNIYYETLPAANEYVAVKYTVDSISKILSEYKSVVSIGYGGVFLGTYAALIYNKELLVYYFSGDEDCCLLRESIIFFDDYISTGKSILKAYHSLSIQDKCLALVMYAKNKCDKLPFEVNIAHLIETF